MSREILFRGKRVDNGEWVEGNLRIDYLTNKLNNGPYLMYISNQNRYSFDFDSVQIKSESVGQFTGRLSRGGKKIFEGDIDGNFGFVFYLIETASFRIKYPTHSIGLDYTDQVFEIIGNIHDNPELI